MANLHTPIAGPGVLTANEVIIAVLRRVDCTPALASDPTPQTGRSGVWIELDASRSPPAGSSEVETHSELVCTRPFGFSNLENSLYAHRSSLAPARRNLPN